MRHVSYVRAAIALMLLVSVLMPAALCFGAVTSAPHPCCIKQNTGWKDGGSAHNECCVVSAPAPNQAAVITSVDHQVNLAAPAEIFVVMSAPAAQSFAAIPSSEHSPPASVSRTTLRI